MIENDRFGLPVSVDGEDFAFRRTHLTAHNRYVTVRFGYYEDEEGEEQSFTREFSRFECIEIGLFFLLLSGIMGKDETISDEERDTLIKSARTALSVSIGKTAEDSTADSTPRE